MDPPCNITMDIRSIPISTFYSTYIYLSSMIYSLLMYAILNSLQLSTLYDTTETLLHLQGWYIVTYALGIYHLNLFIAFLTPKIDPAMDFDGKCFTRPMSKYFSKYNNEFHELYVERNFYIAVYRIKKYDLIKT